MNTHHRQTERPGDLVEVRAAGSTREENLVLPSRVLTEEQRARFEDKSNMSSGQVAIREYGTLWRYTEFFRDETILRLPEWLASQSLTRLPIYSFGCCTGQEPYSLHLVLRERFGSKYHEKFPIYGYDLDEYSIAAARSGNLLVDWSDTKGAQNTVKQLRGLGVSLSEISGGRLVAVIPAHADVHFAKRNVLDESFQYTEPVVVFLQNVLFHLRFDQQFAVMDRLCALPPDSMLCLGHSTFTDRAAASILHKSGMFSPLCGLKNMLLRI